MSTRQITPLFQSTQTVAELQPPILHKSNQNGVSISTAMDILNYGADAVTKAATLSDKILAENKGSDLPIFETNVITVLSIAKGIDLSQGADSGNFLTKMLNSAARSREKLVNKFTSLSTQIDNILGEIQQTSTKLVTRNQILDKMYEENLAEYNKLQQYIDAGTEFLNIKKEELERAKVLAANDMAEIQNVNDSQAFVDRLEKRLDTLKVMQTVTMQTSPVIRLIQQNNLLLVEKFGDLTNLTIPAWKKQVVLSLSLSDQKQGVQLANAIDDATNAFMISNSNLLNQNTKDVYKASQRSVVDISTLQHVQSNLISTLTDIATITKDGKEARAQAQRQMLEMKQQYVNLATNSQLKQA